MNVILAKSAGFCFGVKRAVDMVYKEADRGDTPIYTYGPICLLYTSPSPRDA